MWDITELELQFGRRQFMPIRRICWYHLVVYSIHISRYGRNQTMKNIVSISIEQLGKLKEAKLPPYRTCSFIAQHTFE